MTDIADIPVWISPFERVVGETMLRPHGVVA